MQEKDVRDEQRPRKVSRDEERKKETMESNTRGRQREKRDRKREIVRERDRQGDREMQKRKGVRDEESKKIISCPRRDLHHSEEYVKTKPSKYFGTTLNHKH